MAGVYDEVKMKMAQDAILDRIVQLIGNVPAATVKELSEAFRLLEGSGQESV